MIRRTPHQLGERLSGEKRIKIEKLLNDFDFNMPGNCVYEHNVIVIPDILTQIPLPRSSTRKDLESVFHYYNYQKFLAYQTILGDNSFQAISEAIHKANRIRWDLVTICSGIIYKHFKKYPTLEEFETESITHLHQSVDRFNPTLGFAPSTYICTSMKRHIWKVKNGNTNDRNLNLHYTDQNAGNTPDYRDDLDYFETHESAHQFIKSLSTSNEQYIIQARFFDGMTLQEIADVLSMSKERVRQIERTALDKMRSKVNRVQCPIASKSHQP